MTAAEIRQRILDAGIKYPLNWDEMGSSEKDLWEDRQIDLLNGQRPRARNY